MKNTLRSLFVLSGFMLLLTQTACSSVAYYAQAVNGHFKIMNARESIDKLIEAPNTDETLRKKLVLLKEARVYASSALGLPDNDSYSSYVETGRDYVTWNVVASPEFSLMPETWCFPIAGCVSYRGYFAEQKAEAYADALKQKGFDAIVGGASAYSTLGWFEDPLLDTMIKGGELRLIGVLFHELAHQELYVKDDSNFNEAYASFVEQAGVRQWLLDKNQSDRIQAYDDYLKRQIEFGDLLTATRKELLELYKQEISEEDKRAAKVALFDNMRSNYENLKTKWNGYSGYDGWFKRELNNARLISVATYRKWVPAFNSIFIEQGRDFKAFYRATKDLSELPISERSSKLQTYLDAN